MGKDKKHCNNCNETKEVTEFYKSSNKGGGYRPRCKACYRQQSKEYDSRPEVKKRKSKRAKEYNADPKVREHRIKKQKEYAATEAAKEKRAKYLEEYYSKEENRARRSINSLRHHNKKRAEDPAYRLQCMVGTAVWRGLKGLRKTCSTFEALPYTPEQLKEHLESQFEDWMTWDNYGDWHVDHIFPQSLLPYDSFDHPNFIRCWSLDNLRPLEARENIIKSNKILDQFL